jgi:hypothetical protein
MVTGLTADERAFFHEALRAVPGMLACKSRSDREGMAVLHRAMIARGTELGMTACETHGLMFSAALHWFMQATTALAREKGKNLDEVIEGMTWIAALWESEDAR